MNHHIAVVDDEEILCELLTEVLAEEGYPARAFTSAQACLQAMQGGFRPRLIFVDLRMRGLSGADFVRRVRSGARGGDVHIYVVTGSMLEDDYPPRGEIQGVIGKPFDLDQILDIARSRLGAPQPEPGAVAPLTGLDHPLSAGGASAG